MIYVVRKIINVVRKIIYVTRKISRVLLDTAHDKSYCARAKVHGNARFHDLRLKKFIS